MNEENNNNFAGVWVLYTLISGGAWIALIIAKVCGAIRMKWIGVLLGAIWLPMVVMALMVAIVCAFWLLRTAKKRIREWKRRRRAARTLWAAMEGLTMNKIGPIYGVKRQQGEKNRAYKRRILKAARTVDTVNMGKVEGGGTNGL